MPIQNFHKIEQPRERLQKYGEGKLSTAELLAIILRTGLKGSNVIKVAEKALAKYKGSSLANAGFMDLKKIKGGDENKIQDYFNKLGWRLYTPDQIRGMLKKLVNKGWEDNAIVLSAKLILRQ